MKLPTRHFLVDLSHLADRVRDNIEELRWARQHDDIPHAWKVEIVRLYRQLLKTTGLSRLPTFTSAPTHEALFTVLGIKLSTVRRPEWVGLPEEIALKHGLRGESILGYVRNFKAKYRAISPSETLYGKGAPPDWDPKGTIEALDALLVKIYYPDGVPETLPPLDVPPPGPERRAKSLNEEVAAARARLMTALAEQGFEGEVMLKVVDEAMEVFREKLVAQVQAAQDGAEADEMEAIFQGTRVDIGTSGAPLPGLHRVPLPGPAVEVQYGNLDHMTTQDIANALDPRQPPQRPGRGGGISRTPTGGTPSGSGSLPEGWGSSSGVATRVPNEVLVREEMLKTRKEIRKEEIEQLRGMLEMAMNDPDFKIIIASDSSVVQQMTREDDPMAPDEVEEAMKDLWKIREPSPTPEPAAPEPVQAAPPKLTHEQEMEVLRNLWPKPGEDRPMLNLTSRNKP